MAHGALRKRLLLAFPSLQESATSEKQHRILDEKASAERASGQEDHQTPEKFRMAMRSHLGVPSEEPSQIGQDPSPPVSFVTSSLIAGGLEGRCRPPLLDNFQRAQRAALKVEGVDRKRADAVGRDAETAQKHMIGAPQRVDHH